MYSLKRDTKEDNSKCFMSPLSKKRVYESSPFTYTGVYYFGQIYGKTVTKKIWLC